MAQELRTKGGAVLLWRLGALKFGEQSRWSRAPEKHGLWSFPWPYYDSFFTYHQYKDRLPKRLQEHPNSSWPAALEWYTMADGTPLPKGFKLRWPEPDEYGRVGEPTAVSPGGVEVPVERREGFYDEQCHWVDTVGRRILPLRKFWYEGDLYSHINKRGEVGNPGTFMGETDWYRMGSRELVTAIRRARGNRYIERREEGGLSHWKSSVDHLEIFIPRGAGRIS